VYALAGPTPVGKGDQRSSKFSYDGSTTIADTVIRLRPARRHFERSLEQARKLGAEYETALTLRAIAETGSATTGDARAESEHILSRLGVTATPAVPLP
jgi:hypothetical protein